MHSKPPVDAPTVLSCFLIHGLAELLAAQPGSTYDKRLAVINTEVGFGKNHFLESNERAKSADDNPCPIMGNNCQTHKVRKSILWE